MVGGNVFRIGDPFPTQPERDRAGSLDGTLHAIGNVSLMTMTRAKAAARCSARRHRISRRYLC
jgi:hypothetical protein